MSRNKLIIAVSLATFFILSALTIRHLGSKRVIVKTTAPNGIEFCIIQRWGEPFNTSAFYRKPSGQWNWFYFDHEDWYWNRGEIEIDESRNLIKIFRDKKLAATFNWQTEVFTRGENWQTAETKAAVPPGKNPWDDF